MESHVSVVGIMVIYFSNQGISPNLYVFLPTVFLPKTTKEYFASLAVTWREILLRTIIYKNLSWFGVLWELFIMHSVTLTPDLCFLCWRAVLSQEWSGWLGLQKNWLIIYLMLKWVKLTNFYVQNQDSEISLNEMYASAHSHALIMITLTENHETEPEKVNIVYSSLWTALDDIVYIGSY